MNPIKMKIKGVAKIGVMRDNTFDLNFHIPTCFPPIIDKEQEIEYRVGIIENMMLYFNKEK